MISLYHYYTSLTINIFTTIFTFIMIMIIVIVMMIIILLIYLAACEMEGWLVKRVRAAE